MNIKKKTIIIQQAITLQRPCRKPKRPIFSIQNLNLSSKQTFFYPNKIDWKNSKKADLADLYWSFMINCWHVNVTFPRTNLLQNTTFVKDNLNQSQKHQTPIKRITHKTNTETMKSSNTTKHTKEYKPKVQPQDQLTSQ